MTLQSPSSKVHPRDDKLLAAIAALPRPIIFTNGVFDILHSGHVSYLHEARKLGGSLIVAINTDNSARSLGKGPERPLNRDIDRALVLAGLESVSLVTFFNERTPVALLKELRPDIYVKGGDYDMSTLEESRVIESWGGHALSIPFLEGYSTTSLVRRIQGTTPAAPRKAAFLDRDGVINRDKAYVHEWVEFEFMPGAIEAMRKLKQAGYALVVVTNQSGIARGMYTEAQYETLTTHMRAALEQADAAIDGVFHCPHHPSGKIAQYAIECDCRKPQPGLIARATQALQLDLSNSIMIGDKPSDIEAARSAGVGKAYKVLSDNQESSDDDGGSDGVFQNLLQCVDALLANTSAPSMPR